MTLDQLKYFLETARFEHIGKAAKSVHISPSAVSAAIAALEAELDVSLFDRLGKTIVLTEAGKKLQKEAEIIFDQMQGIRTRVAGSQSQLTGHFRMGASHFLAHKVLTPALTSLQKISPDLVTELSSLSSAQVVTDVVSGALDFGLCFSPFHHPELHLETISQGQLQVAVRSGHPLVREKLDTRKDLKLLSNYPAVIHKSRPGVDICEHHPIFDEFKIETKPSFLFDDDSCAVEKIIHSDAWAFLPDIVVNHHFKKIKALEMPSNWKAPYSITLITRRDRINNVVFQKVKEILTF